MNEHSSSEQSTPADQTKARKFLHPSRIVLWVFILIGLIVIAWDGQARWAYNETFKSISSTMETGDASHQGLYSENLEGLIRGWPSRTEETQTIELLEWKGLMRTHQMRLTYGKGGFVAKIE